MSYAKNPSVRRSGKTVHRKYRVITQRKTPWSSGINANSLRPHLINLQLLHRILKMLLLLTLLLLLITIRLIQLILKIKLESKKNTHKKTRKNPPAHQKKKTKKHTHWIINHSNNETTAGTRRDIFVLCELRS